MRLRHLLSCAVLTAIASATLTATPARRPRRRSRPFVATAYCKDGETQSGLKARPGIIAADPRVLPTGSVVRVDGVGKHSVTYVVEDHGVKGRRIDIFMRSCRAAKRFGRRVVHVRVVTIGDGRRLRPDGR